jgi:pyridoxal phosphate enzyme (YggS family)
MDETTADVAGNYRKILEKIRAAAERAGRPAQQIKLLGASKSQEVEKIRAALEAGVRLFGENYVQEAAAKIKAVGGAAEWHMIGHLQRNKVKIALELFSVIETLDSVELARALNKEAEKRGTAVRSFVEINLEDEESKSGIRKDKLARLLEEVAKLSHLRVEGLMTVPPLSEDPEASRPFFCALRELQAAHQRLSLPNVELKELSMGMTHDFVVAVEEGATIVRIGTALFGPRKS